MTSNIFSPNYNINSILRRNQTSSTSSWRNHDLSMTKTVYIKENKHHVTIMVMDPLTAPSWHEKSCFDTLRSNAYLLFNHNHTIADIVNMVIDEIPSNSNAAFQESQSTSDAVKVDILAVTNLTPETILDSKEQDVSIDLFKTLKDRDPDITFMWFWSAVDCYTANDRITMAGPLSTHFSICLPRHLSDSSDNSVTLSSPVISVSNLPTSSNHTTGASIVRQLFTTPGGDVTTPMTTTIPTTTTLPFTSLKMGFLSRSSFSLSNTFSCGYYGFFDFLDDDKNSWQLLAITLPYCMDTLFLVVETTCQMSSPNTWKNAVWMYVYGYVNSIPLYSQVLIRTWA